MNRLPGMAQSSKEVVAVARSGDNPSSCVNCSGFVLRGVYLQCLHTGCSACLANLLRDDGTIVCPSCRMETKVPFGSVDSLPANYLALSEFAGQTQATTSHSSCEECGQGYEAGFRCDDCSQLLCDIHAASHRRSRATRGHCVSAISHMSTQGGGAVGDSKRTMATSKVLCHVHGRELSHYCKPCNRVLCDTCCELGTHSTHSVVGVELIEPELRSRVQCQLGECERLLVPLEEAMKSVEKRIGDVNAETDVASAEIDSLVKDLKNILDAQQNILKEALDKARWKKLQRLEKQLTKLKESKECMIRASSLGSSAVAIYSAQQFIQVGEWLSELLLASRCVACDSQSLQPCENTAVKFASNGDKVRKALHQVLPLGVVEDGEIEIGRSTVEWDMVGTVHSVTTAKVTLRSKQGIAISGAESERLINIKVEDPSGKLLATAIEVKSKHTEVSFQAMVPGVHHLCVLVRGQHIQHSPLAISVHSHHVFDPNACGRSVLISRDGRCAHSTGKGAVISLETVEVGDQWKMRVNGSNRCMECGVSCKPPPGGYMGGTGSFALGQHLWGWHSDKFVYSHRQRAFCREIPVWTNGDILSFTLSHNQTLSLTHVRAGQCSESRVAGVQAPVFLYVRFNDLEQSVELLD